MLRRLGIHYQRARSYIHSPDPAYDEKLARIEALQQRVQAHPEEVLHNLDECTLHQQPSVAQAYDQAGSDRPYAAKARSSSLACAWWRPWMPRAGRVLFKRWGKIGTKQLSAFYAIRAGQLSGSRAHLAHPR